MFFEDCFDEDHQETNDDWKNDALAVLDDVDDDDVEDLDE